MGRIAAPTQSFLEGVEAKRARLKRGDNPYDLQTPEHDDWEAGRTASYDLDEDSDPASNRDQPADNPDAPDEPPVNEW